MRGSVPTVASLTLVVTYTGSVAGAAAWVVAGAATRRSRANTPKRSFMRPVLPLLGLACDGGMLDVLTLTDGGQHAPEIAERLVAWLADARKSLDLALYDVRLPGPVGD